MYVYKFLARLVIWIQFVDILLTRQPNNTLAQNKSFQFFFASKLPSKNNLVLHFSLYPSLYIWTMLASVQCHSLMIQLSKKMKSMNILEELMFLLKTPEQSYHFLLT